MLQRAAPPICGRLILLLSAVLTDSCVVDAPTPLAALETTPRPTRLVFGDGGPDAVALTVDLVSTIGCGESAWCAELLPLHFAAAGSSAFSQRPSPYSGKAPPVVVGQHAAPRSAALPRAADFLPYVTVCTHFVFAIKESDTLKPTTKQRSRPRGPTASKASRWRGRAER